MNYSELARELLVIHAEFQHLPAGEALSEVSAGEIRALHFLLMNRGMARPTELSRLMSVSTARISSLLRHLEEKGWIVRRRDDNDERCVAVFLTDPGCALARQRWDDAVCRLSELLAALGPKDAADYLRIRKKLLAAASLKKDEGGGL